LFFFNQLTSTIFTERLEIFNYRARGIPQSNTGGASSVKVTPYTYAGLLGNGQIASVADTGVDISSCYFYDPNGSVQPSSTQSPITSSQYRKVIQYTYCSGGGCDTSDAASGHGTHVAGTVCGSISKADISGSNGKMLFYFCLL
jgi:subtilisin family serine protease